MGRYCTVCRDPNVADINAALLAGEAYRDIAARHTYSAATLCRTFWNHHASESPQTRNWLEETEGMKKVRRLAILNEPALLFSLRRLEPFLWTHSVPEGA